MSPSDTVVYISRRCSQSCYFSSVYIDGLLVMLANDNAGCYVAEVLVGRLYADDLVLLAPTVSAMCRLLQICDEYSIIFNA